MTETLQFALALMVERPRDARRRDGCCNRLDCIQVKPAQVVLNSAPYLNGQVGGAALHTHFDRYRG
jgi:hypothetical protein